MGTSRKSSWLASEYLEAPLASSGDSDGNKPKGIPLIGFGTYPFGSDEVKLSVLNAIKAGYRHFDTACLYRAEEPLGEAIAEALSHRLIKSCDELFITSKLRCSDAHPHLVLPSIQKTLKYVDLYLKHWPIALKPGKYEIEIQKEDLLPLDFKGVWEAMEECSKQGLAKYIRVSNFTCKKL
ncbi:Non-functional NADPH-dependent codeinone reductase 2-like protein [Drosera capensis]